MSSVSYLAGLEIVLPNPVEAAECEVRPEIGDVAVCSSDSWELRCEVQGGNQEH
jgi:hypothetical protein